MHGREHDQRRYDGPALERSGWGEEARAHDGLSALTAVGALKSTNRVTCTNRTDAQTIDVPARSRTAGTVAA